MNIRDAYQDFTFRLNKLGTNANQNVGYPQFVSLMNKAQLHWAESRIKVAEERTTRVDELQQLLEDYESVAAGKKENFYRINLPGDYFHRHRAYAQVKDCDGVVYCHFVEEGNINSLLQGSNTAPSAAWEETLATVFRGQLRVYFTDFSLAKVYLKYFRFPRPVDIAGYLRTDGLPSVDVDLEFTGVNAQEIIDFAVLLASNDTGDIVRAQIMSRQVQENN